MKNQLLVFVLDGRHYAVKLQAVERVVSAVEITPLPEGPDMVTGLINVQGQVIPVINVRRKFRLRERELDLDDSIVIVKGSKWAVAFAVDSVEGVIERSDEEIISSEKILPGMEHTEGVVKLGDDIVFLHDIDKALSFEEKDNLNKVMEKHETVV